MVAILWSRLAGFVMSLSMRAAALMMFEAFSRFLSLEVLLVAEVAASARSIFVTFLWVVVRPGVVQPLCLGMFWLLWHS